MKKINNYFPIIPCSSSIRNSSATFFLSDKEIEVCAPKLLIKEILILCDGEKTIDKIVKILNKNWQSILVREFLEHLIRVGVICDSRAISSYIWPFVKNPTRFVNDLSDEEILQLVRKAHKRHKRGRNSISLSAQSSYIQSSYLQEMIERRCSIRVFSRKDVNQHIIARLLWAGYGIVQSPLLVDNNSPQQVKIWQKHSFARHTVPSAGALYPLKLSLGLFRPVGSYDAGIYDVYFRNPGCVELVLINKNVLELLQSFADQTVCNNAQAVIIISGSFEVSGEKYGNRSLLYVPLEAGHVAQNIHLAAVENGIGTVEIGGFLEEPLRKTLKLKTSYWPLTTVLFGYQEAENLITVNGKNNVEVRWANPFVGTYQLPFSMAFVQIKSQKDKDWACGRAKNPHIALLKASSEAYEWDACSCIPHDLIRVSLKELRNAIDPRRIVCYHNSQYPKKNFSLKPFHDDQEYFWKDGREVMTGKMVYVLSDCIYFPYTPATPRYTYANSSGTAAHPNRNEAIKRATLELVERDAFMIVWLNHLAMPQIYQKSLPQDIQIRIRALQRVGFRVIVKDFTIDLAPVVFIFAQNKVLPMTTCAGCSAFELDESLDHALMEVEAAVYCRLDKKPPKSIQPRKVRYTDEHGNLYEQHRFFRQADFLADTKKLLRFTEIAKNTPRTWQELMNLLEVKGSAPITIDLSQTSNQKQVEMLNIVKVFLPGIIPMSFGYGLEPCGMGRIYSLPVQLGYRSTPISYKDLTKFPHPYT
jgi:thiazole/oxazole-forming peptide maturase SagD family component